MPKQHLSDVLYQLVHRSSLNEGEKQAAVATINEHFGDAIDGMDDETKALRPAPVDALAATHPAIATGGITQAQLNAAIAQAIRDYEASRNAQDASKTAQAPMNAEKVQPSSTPEPEQVDYGVAPAAPSRAADPSLQTKPSDVPSRDIPTFEEYQAEVARRQQAQG